MIATVKFEKAVNLKFSALSLRQIWELLPQAKGNSLRQLPELVNYVMREWAREHGIHRSVLGQASCNRMAMQSALNALCAMSIRR